jgi:hypothetical protein
MVRPYNVSFRRFDNHAIPPFDSAVRFIVRFHSFATCALLSPPVSVKKFPLSLSKHAILVKIKRKNFIFVINKMKSVLKYLIFAQNIEFCTFTMESNLCGGCHAPGLLFVENSCSRTISYRSNNIKAIKTKTKPDE